MLSRNAAWFCRAGLPFSIAVVLFVASGAKVRSHIGITRLEMSSVLPLTVAVWEMVVGYGLVCWLGSRQFLSLAAIAFGLFSVFAIWDVAVGARTCGCFGSIRISPAFVVWLDVACEIGIITCAFIQYRSPHLDALRRTWLATGTLAVFCCLGYTLEARNEVARPAGDRPVVMIPQELIGAKLSAIR